MDEFLDMLDGIGVDTERGIEQFVDDEEMYLKYVLAFPEEPTMPKLAAAVEAKDYEAAEKAVHALKGITKNLCFTRLADATEDMLDELRSDNLPDALDAYEDVREQYKRHCDVINAWKAAH